mmetsp:Transcript_42834/g.130265  ORF Transcript_42834/g.130265 Transcript_42834/m.130265 type:complete len:250 (-) Transcript_42834:59-808(-)
MGMDLERGLATVGRSAEAGASSSDSSSSPSSASSSAGVSSSLSSSLPSPSSSSSSAMTLNTTPTGSSPHPSVNASTRACTSPSPHSPAFASGMTASGIGCSPFDRASLYNSTKTPSPAASFPSAALSSSDPPFRVSNTPHAPASAASVNRSSVHSALPFPPPPPLLEEQYTTGTGPGKLPRASSCSAHIVLRLPRLPAMNATFDFALVRNVSLNFCISVVCNSMAVGSVGSGMIISGLSVNLPLGLRRD